MGSVRGEWKWKKLIHRQVLVTSNSYDWRVLSSQPIVFDGSMVAVYIFFALSRFIDSPATL